MPSAASDPWEIVAASKRLRVITRRLPDGLAGATDGTWRICLDNRLTAVERRCVLTHELVHVEAGHDGHQGGVHRALGAGPDRQTPGVD